MTQTMTAARTMSPVEHARFYYENVWMQHKVELIPELCADPVLRHDFARDYQITHAEQRDRILAHEGKGYVFRILNIHGDDQYATIIWEITSPTYNMAGIEVMHIPGGRIVEVWNAKRDGVMWPK